jgi:hypothetical protein
MHQAGLRFNPGMSGVKDIVVHASPVIMLSMSEEQAARRLYDGIASTTRPFHKIIGVAFSPTAGAAGPRVLWRFNDDPVAVARERRFQLEDKVKVCADTWARRFRDKKYRVPVTMACSRPSCEHGDHGGGAPTVSLLPTLAASLVSHTNPPPAPP